MAAVSVMTPGCPLSPSPTEALAERVGGRVLCHWVQFCRRGLSQSAAHYIHSQGVSRGFRVSSAAGRAAGSAWPPPDAPLGCGGRVCPVSGL